MAEGDPEVTLDTLHGEVRELRGEVRELRGEVREGFAGVTGEIRDLKVTMIKGFAGMPTRESSEEMIRLLRENNRMHEARLAEVDSHVIQVDSRVVHADARRAARRRDPRPASADRADPGDVGGEPAGAHDRDARGEDSPAPHLH